MNTPVPSIAPRPMTTAPSSPSSRRSRVAGSSEVAECGSSGLAEGGSSGLAEGDRTNLPNRLPASEHPRYQELAELRGRDTQPPQRGPRDRRPSPIRAIVDLQRQRGPVRQGQPEHALGALLRDEPV